MAHAILTEQIPYFENEIFEHGAYEVPTPFITLQNKFHEMFRGSRWAKGHGQHTELFWQRMKPAFQLASNFLLEDCTLPWFNHVAFGTLKKTTTHDGKRKTFIKSQQAEHRPRNKQEVKERLGELGDIITFMFVPDNYRNHPQVGKPWGMTFSYPEDVPMYREMYGPNSPYWPHWRPMYEDPRDMAYLAMVRDRPKPVIILRNEFQEFFLNGWLTATPSQRYRVQFMFASVLMHEIAHAFWFYVSEDGATSAEPYWSKHDKKAELGYSWESTTLGRVIDPIRQEITNCGALASIQTETFRGAKCTDKKLAALVNFEGMVTRPIHEDGSSVWKTRKIWRGLEWLSEDDGQPLGMNTITVLHVIPMWWIIHWFSEEEWEKKRREYRRTKRYIPPALGPTFVLIYQRFKNGYASLQYSSRADIDPYLGRVAESTADMHLYDPAHFVNGTNLPYIDIYNRQH